MPADEDFPTYLATSRSITSPRQLALDLFHLARPFTCIAGFVEVILGAHLIDRSQFMNARSTLAGLSAIFLIAAAQSFNDAHDVDVDRPTKPHRPVASGRISVTFAKVYAVICAILGIGLVVPLGSFWLIISAIFAAFISFAYSLWFKGTILFGNAVVASIASCLVAYGAISVGDINRLVVLVCIGIATYQTGFEIIKTLRDRDDDAQAGLVTLGSVNGSIAVKLGHSLTTIALILFLLGGKVSANPLMYYLIAIVGVIVPNLFAVFLVPHAEADRVSIRRALALMRIGWIPGLIALSLLGEG